MKPKTKKRKVIIMTMTEITSAVITIIATILTALVIPLIRAKLGEAKFAELVNYVTIAVKAAEQIFTGSGRGAEKKAYVIEWLKSKGIDVTSEDVNNAIEAAVNMLKDGVTNGSNT